MTALLYLLAERFTRAEILWHMPLREAHEHEHCAYLASRTPVRFADTSADTAANGDLLAVFRSPPTG